VNDCYEILYNLHSTAAAAMQRCKCGTSINDYKDTVAAFAEFVQSEKCLQINNTLQVPSNKDKLWLQNTQALLALPGSYH